MENTEFNNETDLVGRQRGAQYKARSAIKLATNCQFRRLQQHCCFIKNIFFGVATAVRA